MVVSHYLKDTCLLTTDHWSYISYRPLQYSHKKHISEELRLLIRLSWEQKSYVILLIGQCEWSIRSLKTLTRGWGVNFIDETRIKHTIWFFILIYCIWNLTWLCFNFHPLYFLKNVVLLQIFEWASDQNIILIYFSDGLLIEPFDFLHIYRFELQSNLGSHF